MRKIIIGVMFLLLVSLVIGATSMTTNKPSAYSTYTTTDINVSVLFSQTTNGEVEWNITLFNKSSLAGSYGANVPSGTNLTIQNNSFWNYTVSLNDDTRHWIFARIINATGGTVDSTPRIIDIDTGFLVFSVGQYGAINMTLNTGDINTSGIVTAQALRVRNGTRLGSYELCTAANEGTINYNSSIGFIGCTAQGWKSLNTTITT